LKLIIGGALSVLVFGIALVAAVMNPQLGKVIGGGVVLLALLPVYFLPSISAQLGHRRNAGAIFVLNLLLGWTLLGWVAALVWAMVKDPINHRR